MGVGGLRFVVWCCRWVLLALCPSFGLRVFPFGFRYEPKAHYPGMRLDGELPVRASAVLKSHGHKKNGPVEVWREAGN